VPGHSRAGGSRPGHQRAELCPGSSPTSAGCFVTRTAPRRWRCPTRPHGRQGSASCSVISPAPGASAPARRSGRVGRGQPGRRLRSRSAILCSRSWGLTVPGQWRKPAISIARRAHPAGGHRVPQYPASEVRGRCDLGGC